MNKPPRSRPRPLAELLHKTLGDAFAKQGFASTELVTRWTDIVGPEIAAHSQPESLRQRVQQSRVVVDDEHASVVHWGKGRWIRNVAPSPGGLTTEMVPPCSLMIP